MICNWNTTIITMTVLYAEFEILLSLEVIVTKMYPQEQLSLLMLYMMLSECSRYAIDGSATTVIHTKTQKRLTEISGGNTRLRSFNCYTEIIKICLFLHLKKTVKGTIFLYYIMLCSVYNVITVSLSTYYLYKHQFGSWSYLETVLVSCHFPTGELDKDKSEFRLRLYCYTSASVFYKVVE